MQYYWYERSLRLFNEYFGKNMLLKNITRSGISKFLNRFGEGHADETVRKVNGCLSQCLKDAVYDGHIKKTQHIT